MNTKYGRLKNGQIEYAPVSLDTGDGVKMNPSEASYLAAGWKKVVDVMPTVEAGHRAVVSGWREDADTLTCVYKVVAGETPVASARVFSKLKLVAALKEADKWVLVKTWIEERGYYDYYVAAQNFREDNPLFTEALAAIKGYGIDEIKRLKGLCEEYGLEGREILDKYTDEELAALFNGIGPEAFPSWLRTALDALHPSLAPVAMIHDVEWSESDGREETFAASNARFRRNGCKVASASFGWWRPRRYLVMWDSVKFARICQRFGWGAFLAPYEARQKGGDA